MDEASWMDWRGWTWVSLLMTAGVFFYFGWDARRMKARSDEFLADLRTRPALDLVAQLSRMTDPRDSQNHDEELEAFAAMIRKAKMIAGDNAPELK